MKKNLPRSEEWSQRLSYALILLVLIDSIVPFTWNAWRRRPSNGQSRRCLSHDYAWRLVDNLGKVAKGKSLWSTDEFGLEGGFDENDSWNKFGFKSGSRKFAGVQQMPDEIFRTNLSVFILPDLRRNVNGNENVAAVASNQELSLQDSDAIDFYWRQDIDAEKGLYPNLWSPDLQYERDVQLVTEKTLLQPDYTTDQNFRYIPDQNDILRDLIQAQKEHFGSFDNLPTAGATSSAKVGGWESGKAPFAFEWTTAQQQHQPTPTDNAYGGALDGLDLDWLNSSSIEPLNDVFLDTNHAQTGGYNAEQGHTSSEYDFLAAGDDLNTPPVSMDWETRSVPLEPAANVIEQNTHDPMLFNGIFAPNEFEGLPTPDLMLAPSDIACIFGDHQVVQDVAEAQTTKEMLLYQAPVAVVESFPSASDSDLMAFVPAVVGDSFSVGHEQSEVVIEELPPYNDPFSAPTTTRQHTSPAVTTWSTEAAHGAGALSVSPTWRGDHDYTSEASGAEGAHPPEWSYDENVIKSEPHYDDDYEEETDEDSSEMARAASERDELRARQLNLPFTAADIVTMPQQEYVSVTRSKGRFTKEQIELIKEIRRHGGNKEAARRSRQKKVQMSKQLEDEVHLLERERNAMLAEYKKLLREIEVEDRAIEDLKRRNRK